MREIWKMWRLLCFFKRRRAELALILVREKAEKKARAFRISEIKGQIAKKTQELGRELTEDETGAIFNENPEDDFDQYLAYREIDSYHKEALVNRKNFVTSYFASTNERAAKTYAEMDFYAQLADKETHEKKIEINSTLESCLAPSNAFLENDPQNLDHIRLTDKGKKFATIDGLVKEMVINGIGQLWSLGAVAVTASIAGYNTTSLVELVNSIGRFIR